MNPTFSSPRSIPNPYSNTHSAPFYNPQQKQVNGAPFVPQATKPVPAFMQQQLGNNSKSYQFKNGTEVNKNTGNNSAYLKSSTEGMSNSSFPNFSGGYNKTAGEMTKSSFHDPPRVVETHGNFPKGVDRAPMGTPPRRAPRFSEPGNMDSPYQSTQDTKGSFIPYSNKGLERTKDDSKQQFQKKSLMNSGTLQKSDQKPERVTKPPPPPFNLNFPIKKPKTISLESFDQLRNLGKGKYGNVFLVRQKLTGCICALKVIEKAVLKQQQIVDQFIREVKIQMFLSHPNIIKMYGCFDDKDHIYIVLEMALDGQLYQQLKRSEPMAEIKAASYMKQICTAVQQLHGNRIIHRDIKPENIVMHEGVVKLCDFGWSVHLDNKMRTTFCGTPLYVCPQILKGNEYDEKIDIWSLGIMMYEMLIGENPFKINTEEELIKIVKEEISIPSYVFVSRQARDFLDKCLKKNPMDRVTIQELSNHSVFNKNAEKEKAEKKMMF